MQQMMQMLFMSFGITPFPHPAKPVNLGRIAHRGKR